MTPAQIAELLNDVEHYGGRKLRARVEIALADAARREAAAKAA